MSIPDNVLLYKSVMFVLHGMSSSHSSSPCTVASSCVRPHVMSCTALAESTC